MRELKFRAWNEQRKKIIFGPTDGNDSPSWILALMDDVPKMQYTGLKDKNGKEIYEGDIVNHLYHHQKAVIEWINCGLMMKYSDGLKDSMFAIDMEHIEIIGNIYENPELLNRHC